MEFAQEQRCIRILAILPLGKIPPEESPRRLAKVHDASLASLGLTGLARPDLDPARFHIYILNAQSAQLAGSQPCIQEGQQDSLISLGG